MSRMDEEQQMILLHNRPVDKISTSARYLTYLHRRLIQNTMGGIKVSVFTVLFFAANSWKMTTEELQDISITQIDELEATTGKNLYNEIRSIVCSPTANLSTLTLKDVRLLLSKKLGIPLRTVYENTNLKKLSKSYTVQLLQQCEATKEKHEETNAKTTHSELSTHSIKERRPKDACSSGAATSETASTNKPQAQGTIQSSEENRRLQKLIADLGIGPSIRKNLDKSNEAVYIETLKARLKEKCVEIGITHKEYRLPTEKEVLAYKRKRKLEKELDGIDAVNILENTKRNKRSF